MEQEDTQEMILPFVADRLSNQEHPQLKTIQKSHQTMTIPPEGNRQDQEVHHRGRMGPTNHLPEVAVPDMEVDPQTTLPLHGNLIPTTQSHHPNKPDMTSGPEAPSNHHPAFGQLPYQR